MPESNPSQPQYHSFTLRFPTKANVILGPISIRAVSTLPDGAQPPGSSIHQTTALWDTGASGSVVTAATVSALGLIPIAKTLVNHAGGQSLEDVYLVDVILPNGLTITALRVTGCGDNTGNFGVLVGMDVMGLGDVAISNFEGKTAFTFRIPSKKEIDFNTPVQPQTKGPLVNARQNGYLPPARGRKR